MKKEQREEKMKLKKKEEKRVIMQRENARESKITSQ